MISYDTFEQNKAEKTDPEASAANGVNIHLRYSHLQPPSISIANYHPSYRGNKAVLSAAHLDHRHRHQKRVRQEHDALMLIPFPYPFPEISSTDAMQHQFAPPQSQSPKAWWACMRISMATKPTS